MFKNYLESHGIHHRFTCSHIHQQNESSERKHRPGVCMRLTILSIAFLPFKYQGETFLIATFITNSLPTFVLGNIIPYEKLFLRHFIIISHSFEFLVIHFWDLSINTSLIFIVICVFLGYNNHHKWYVCLSLHNYIYIYIYIS